MSSRPKNRASTVACDVPMAAMLPAYEGYGGAVMYDDHAGSGAVSGLPSSSARRIAVIGRHRPCSNLLPKVVCSASCSAMFVSAKSRDVSTVVKPRDSDTVRATLFQTNRKFVGVPTFAQSRATSDWSAVRVALVTEPISLTSFKSAAYRALVIAGGGG